MSQPRNRRPVSRAREPPRAAAPPANYVTSDAKENYGNKNTYQIPKSVRYDLENALVGLCDIWFEEIKPHLVKNKLKLHTGGLLNEDMEPVREHRSTHVEPRRSPRRLLDPGAASDIRRPAVNCRAYSPTRPAASRAPCPRPPSPSRPMPLSPNNFRKLLQLPGEKRTCQPARSTRASPPLTQTYQVYQRDSRKSTNQWMRSPVQETPLRQPSPPFTRTRTHQQKDHHTPDQRAAKARKQQPDRRPSRSPTTTPTPLIPIYQHNDQDTSINRKTRKSKKIRRPQFPSLSQQRPRQVLRPCCTACAVAANAETAKLPQRPLAPTRLPPPRTKKTLPSKPPPDNKNADTNKLRRFDVKIPHVNYPTQKLTAGTLPLPASVRISPAGDVPQSTQITAGNSAFLQDSSAIQNVFVWNPSQRIHSVNKAPVPPKFEKNLRTQIRATNISPAGDVPPFQHATVDNSLSLNVAAGNYLPLQDSTRIPHNIVRKPPQNHSANTVPVSLKFERNWPSPLCGTNISSAVCPPSLHDAAGDSPHPSDFAGIPKPLNAVSTAPVPPSFRRKAPCAIRGVSILPSPAHAKCMSSVHARSQNPISSPPPPPSEDEIWFDRLFKEDMTRQRGTRQRRKENSVLVYDIRTSSSQTPSINEESHQQNECDYPLFSKDLIDLIGDKNDERLRVLYENPARDESHPSVSVIHLVGSRNKQRKTAPKKKPWR